MTGRKPRVPRFTLSARFWRLPRQCLLICTGLWVAPSLAADASDWPDMAHYRAANAALPAAVPGRVVFMGDSITEGWKQIAPGTAAAGLLINRGISGQTTPQMLLRFRQDVIALQPQVVMIMAGTNDLAGNTGPARLEDIQANLASMAELARVHGLRVVFGSVLPARSFWWHPGIDPADRIESLNAWLRQYAKDSGAAYVDFYAAMVDDRRDIKKAYSDDGVHPNSAGYRLMTEMAEQVLGGVLTANGKEQHAIP